MGFSIVPAVFWWPSVTKDFELILLGVGIGCAVSLAVLSLLVVFFDG